MAKSEKAKALEAQQKAAIKAEKLRKKNSDDPRDWGKTKQLIMVYKRTVEVDPKLNLFMALAALAGIALSVVVGILLNSHWGIIALMALMMALTGAMIVLTARAKTGTYARYAGQVGAPEVAFSMLNTKKFSYQMAVVATRDMDLIHRVIGPCGVVLVGEGQAGRVRQMLNTEQKRHQQVLYGIPVTTMYVGEGANAVKLEELTKKIQKLPKAIRPAQQTSVSTKLKALDAVRPKVPLPKGPMPSMKGMNRAMRGR